MKITVVFSDRKEKALLTELIKWEEKTNYSHVSIMFEDSYIYEAVYPYFRRIHVNEWLKYNAIIKTITFDVPLFDYNNAHAKAMSLLGTKYSFAQLGLIYIENSFKRVLCPIGDKFESIKLNNNRRLICTESDLVILKEIGLKYKGSRDTISLNDFDSIVSKFKEEKYK